MRGCWQLRFAVLLSVQAAFAQQALTSATSSGQVQDAFVSGAKESNEITLLSGLSTGVTIGLPRRSYVSTNVNYGSGFLDGDGPQHLPGHITSDNRVLTCV